MCSVNEYRVGIYEPAMVLLHPIHAEESQPDLGDTTKAAPSQKDRAALIQQEIRN